MAEGGALREVFALFSIEIEGEELEKASKNVEGFIDKLKVGAKVVAEAFAVNAIKEFVEHQAEAATELERTAARLGMTTAAVQEFTFAAGNAGVRAESMTSGLRFLNRNIASAAAGGGAAATEFQKLGIHLTAAGKTREVGDVMKDLADKFAAIPDASKKTKLAMELFGRGGAELIPILNQGSVAFEEARVEMEKLGGPTSKEMIESSKELEEQQNKLNFGMDRLKDTIAMKLLPILTAIVSHGTELVKDFLDVEKHTNALSTALYALGGVALYKAVGGLSAVMTHLGLLKPSLLETIGALWEFAAPAVIVFALYLVFDDLYTMMKGGQSVIGQTLDQLFGFGTSAAVVEELNNEWARGSALLKDMGDIIGDVATIVVETLGAAIHGIIAKVGDVANAFKALAHGDFKGAGDALLADHPELEAKRAALVAAGKDIGRAFGGKGSAMAKQRDKEAEMGAFGSLQGDGKVKVGHIVFGDVGPKHGGHAHAPAAAHAGREQGHVREPQALTFGAVAAHGGVHMSITNHTVVHTKSDQPKAIGEAVGQGQSTAAERAASQALAAQTST